MIVAITHVIREHAGSPEAPFTGSNIPEILLTTPNRDRAERVLAEVSSVPQPLTVVGFRLGDATLEI